MRARRLAATLALTTLTLSTLTSLAAAPGPATAQERLDSDHPEHVKHDLAKARKATARFTDERKALKAGYKRTDECVSATEGGMGYHYVKEAYIGSTDPAKPAVLVYVPGKDGKRQLGALEYVVMDRDKNVNTDDDRPRMFGRGFDGPMAGHAPEMPIHYDLHVWLYKHNPDGLLAAFNPDVRCPAS
ncbi:hypothetical protein [Streptomyces violens]|uniref:hypothetical protein n=1 Tax=Streptomyces violens TaxID=66377 RepID=UPI0004C1D5DD|nr:hypothetical protein [Streptomyces violens]